MIQCARGAPSQVADPLLLGALSLSVVPTVAAAEEGLVAIYWQPPGAPAPGPAVRAAFAEAVRPLGARLLDATTPPPEAASLAPALEAARADYARFAFAEAVLRLDQLQRTADAQGGGDLDGRQLSEIFFYRGLCQLEAGRAEAAWEDLVRAARLDPTRLIDPARYPPRAVTAYARAVAEVTRLPRAELVVEAPAGALVRIDGTTAAGPAAVTLGQHFVTVSAEGYEPWSAVQMVGGARERVVPPLRPYRPPEGDRLLALAGEPPPSRVLLGALERGGGGGWRFVARDVSVADGKFLSEAVVLSEEAPLQPVVAGLVRRVTSQPPPPPAPKKPLWRGWPWAVGAAALVVAGGAVAIGVAYGTAPTSGSVGGRVSLGQ